MSAHVQVYWTKSGQSTLYSVPMYFEGGQWMVGSILPNPLRV